MVMIHGRRSNLLKLSSVKMRKGGHLLKFSSVKPSDIAVESRRQAGFTETFFSKIGWLGREAPAVIGFC